MKRGQPLKTKKPLERKTRLRPMSAKKAAELAEKKKAKKKPPVPPLVVVLDPPADAWPEPAPPPRLVRPPEPLRVTTARPAPAPPIEKRGQLVSETWLEHVRGLPCAFCHQGPWPEEEKERHAIDPHHVKVRGNRGERFDWTVVPACRGAGTRGCHDLAQTMKIPQQLQDMALGRTLREELPRLPKSLHRKVLSEMLEGLGGGL